MEGGLVELVVLLVGDIGLLLGPDGHHGVDGTHLVFLAVLLLPVLGSVFGALDGDGCGELHHDGVAHVVAVALDQVLQGIGVEELAVVELVAILAQGEGDGGAAALALALADAVALEALALPGVGGVRTVGLGDDLDVVCNHEGGVEAHAELADDVDLVGLLGVLALLELQRAGMSDGAEVGLEGLLVHADAVVADGDGAGVLVAADVDVELRAHDAAVAGLERLEVHLVEGVGGVGDQLAEEDLLVGVDGVDHQVQQALGLGLELAHCDPPLWTRVS